MSNIDLERRDLCVVLDPHKVRSQDLHAKHLTSYQSDLQRRRDLCIVYDAYGVVPKRWLTFPGSFYKEVAKTTSGALVYRFERQTSKKNKFFLRKKHSVLELECRILSQESSDSCILYFDIIFHGK